jgi:hypothetical protein
MAAATTTLDEPFQLVDRNDDILVQLSRLRNKLVEKAEEVSIKLEANMNPGVAAGLRGDDQAKARHLFLSQARKIEADLNKLLGLAENFRTHIH